MVNYEHLFHGTNEDYIRMNSNTGYFLSRDRYSSKPLIALIWATKHGKDFESKMAVITLFDVILKRRIEEGGPLSSRGVDILVNQREIEGGRNPNINGIKIYREHEMEEFIRKFVKLENIPRLNIDELIRFYCR